MFQKGQSGNPAGPAKGTRHKITMLAEKLLEDDRDDIVRAVIAAAKGGDPTAMRLLCRAACATPQGQACRIRSAAG
jgi:uncharacterized protein DUF5681